MGRVEWESKAAAVGALEEASEENMGEGEGGEAKSSKSSSKLGAGKGAGLEPPKRPLMKSPIAQRELDERRKV